MPCVNAFNKQARVLEAAGVKLQFLHGGMDKALIGFAEREGRHSKSILACYGYQALKVVLGAKYDNAAEMYAMLQSIRLSTNVAILYKLGYRPLWNTILFNRLHRWDLIDNSIIGIVDSAGCVPSVAYSRPLAVSALSTSHKWSESVSGDRLGIKAGIMLDETIIPTYLGDTTPWFVTPIT